TKQVLQYLIDKQTTKHWKLGTVSMTRYFSYKWENENLLSAIFSVPKPFDIQYRWTWDTTSYPWTLNLVEAETEVSCEIRYAYNMRSLEIEEDPTVIFNRIYPLGYGEGDNQLNIKKINGGIPYVEDKASIEKYGLRAYVWVDKRFEDVKTLKASAEGLLRDWKVPKVMIRGNAADISKITGRPIHELTEGKVVRLVHPDLGVIEQRIVKESKSDFKGNPGDIQLEIANKTEDLGTTTMDLERRQQINELYSQGATNIDSYQYEDNCDSTHPAIIRFYFPDELVRINTCHFSYETSAFRAYERATKGGGATVKSTSSGGGTTATSSSGGGSTATSSSGGGTTATSSSGGGTTATSSSGGNHRHRMFTYDESTGSKTPISNFGKYYAAADSGGQSAALVTMPGAAGDLYTKESSGNHNHNVTVPSHTHSVEIPNHTHSVNIPNHSHTVTIPDHSHNITLPDHTHELEYGIFEYDKSPSKHTIKVDGAIIPITALSGDNINLIPYLSKDSEGKVTRGWHELSIQPNELARVTANIVSQFFIQSRGQGDY
ncbi:MAG: phage tail spike protein, partial [Phocaeicola sp.]